MTQHKIDSVTATIQGTTGLVAAIALTPQQQQTNDIIDYDTGTKLYEKATAALKHVFDHKKGHTVILLT